MSSSTYAIEAKWREGLNRKGRDWVTRELQTRVGQPDDVILDVVYEEPYPSRAFCQRWCIEQDNKTGGPSVATAVTMVILVVIIIAGVAFSISNFERRQPAQSAQSDTH